MATTPAEMSDSYPKLSYKYKVDFGGDEVGFSEITGLSTGNQTVTYTDGIKAVIMPGKTDAVNLTMKRGTYKGNGKLYDWISTTNLNTVEKRDITISLTDDTGAEVVTWSVFDAFPHQFAAPNFNSGTNEVAIETLEIIADYLTVAYN